MLWQLGSCGLPVSSIWAHRQFVGLLAGALLAGGPYLCAVLGRCPASGLQVSPDSPKAKAWRSPCMARADKPLAESLNVNQQTPANPSLASQAEPCLCLSPPGTPAPALLTHVSPTVPDLCCVPYVWPQSLPLPALTHSFSSYCLPSPCPPTGTCRLALMTWCWCWCMPMV